MAKSDQAAPEHDEEHDKELAENRHTILYQHFQERAEGTNINPTTLLTTDYLNHFNGFMMMLEMLPVAPEDMAEELLAWEPATYAQHFKESGFRDRELAIAAYEHVPKEILVPFEHTVDDLNKKTLALRERIAQSFETGDVEDISEMFLIAEEGVAALQALIEQAGSIVNGVVIHRSDVPQSTIDALFD